MPNLDSDSSVSADASSEDEKPKAKKRKSEDRKEKSKKEKKQKVAKEESDSDPGLEDSDAEDTRGLEPGAFWIDQKRNRRIQVREFRGKALVDIRELYNGPNGLAPGKKGISLSIPEWKKLCKLVDKVNKEIAKH